MIGLDILRADKKDVQDKLYGSSLIQQILNSTVFNEASIEFLHNPLVRQYLKAVEGGEQINDKSPMCNIFNEVLERAHKFPSVEKNFESIFEELIEILYSKTFDLRAFTILQNFKADQEKMQLNETNLEIKQCSSNDFSQWRKLLEQGSMMFDGYNNSTSFYIAELKFNHLWRDKIIKHTESNFNLLHRCLKLINSTPVSISTFYFVPEKYSWHPFFLPMFSRNSSIEPVFWKPGEEYHLTDALINDFSNIYNNLEIKVSKLPSDSKRRLELAIDRCIEADSSNYPLVDIVIAFEAVLLPNVNSELKFRLSERVALLIGKSKDERIEIFNNMKKIYDTRSKLVHGEITDKLKKDLETYYLMSRDYLQKTLLILLDMDNSNLGQVFDYMSF